jgi:hypothetical protein
VNRRPAACAALLTATLVVAGCGGGSSSPAAGSSDTTGTGGSTGTSGTSDTTGTPTGPSSGSSSAVPVVTVQGVPLTAQGTKLRLGEPAKVSWKPDQKTTGVLKMAVTQVAKMPISTFRDWRLDAATQQSTPYFVHARVRNLGKAPLSGVPVPLFLLDHRNRLLRASRFTAAFPTCPSTPLPPTFKRGKKASVCLVYFVPDHGTMSAMSFRPTQDFDAITWTGPPAKPPKN